MKIVVLGAGQVGSNVAALLTNEGMDVTVIDKADEKLRALQEKHDIRTVHGHASLPSILTEAGTADAQLLIATTSSDEVNMIACQVAYHMFGTPTRIARIRELDYSANQHLFSNDKISVNVFINPENLLTDYLHSAILFPSALEVMDFAEGKIKLVGTKVTAGGHLAHQKISSLKEIIPHTDTRVAAIYRQKGPVVPTGDTTLEPEDEVFFLAEANDITRVMREFGSVEKDNRKIIIAGGGNIGQKLATKLQKKHRVKLIETNRDRCELLSAELQSVVVLFGSATDRSLMVEEDVGSCHVFCALTNNDEVNILSCLMAKNCGAARTISLVNNNDYRRLLEEDNIQIDKLVTPQQITISRLLSYVRGDDVVRVHSLRSGAAEALEAVAHGDESTSGLVGKKLANIPLPHGVTLGALVREDKVMMAHSYLTVEPEDHLIFFVVDKNSLDSVAKLVESQEVSDNPEAGHTRR